MTKSRDIRQLALAFKVPLLVVIGIILYLLLSFYQIYSLAIPLVFITIIVGSFSLLQETVMSLMRRQFALDYIAILAIAVAVGTEEYLVAAILALMVSGGRTLEAYGVSKAKKSLTQLTNRIPTDVTLWDKDKPGRKESLKNITVGESIFIYKGEVIGIDGVLESERGETDESSLTGEPYFIEKVKGDIIRSGTINIGQPMVIKVTKTEKDSTYKKILAMVQQAEREKSPLVRLADKYSVVFTLVTFFIAGFAYFYSHFDLKNVLAVLAVATPCPLILATPIALLGGMNASAKRKIIIKKLAALETLSRVQTIVFDKTGTITLGEPQIITIEIISKHHTKAEVLAIAEAIERNSLHPLAKAIVREAKAQKVKRIFATHIHEQIGKGISGVVNGKEYSLKKLQEKIGMAIELQHNGQALAMFFFEDKLKATSKRTIQELSNTGLSIHIFTGDKKEAADKLAAELGANVIVKAECTPQEKQQGIETLKKQGQVTAMVGDGINDAPALALADVGMAFSDEEQTAASEAADIVFLGGNFTMVLTSWQIAKRTIVIAKQSILWGIGLSVAAMIFAAVGLIPPIVGAGLQEAIDVAVILNALRASV